MYPVVIFRVWNDHLSIDKSGCVRNTQFSIAEYLGFDPLDNGIEPSEALYGLDFIEFMIWGLIKRANRYPDTHLSQSYKRGSKEAGGRFGDWRFELMLAFGDDDCIGQALTRKGRKKAQIVPVHHNLERGEVSVDMGPCIG